MSDIIASTKKTHTLVLRNLAFIRRGADEVCARVEIPLDRFSGVSLVESVEVHAYDGSGAERFDGTYSLNSPGRGVLLLPREVSCGSVDASGWFLPKDQVAGAYGHALDRRSFAEENAIVTVNTLSAVLNPHEDVAPKLSNALSWLQAIETNSAKQFPVRCCNCQAHFYVTVTKFSEEFDCVVDVPLHESAKCKFITVQKSVIAESDSPESFIKALIYYAGYLYTRESNPLIPTLVKKTNELLLGSYRLHTPPGSKEEPDARKAVFPFLMVNKAGGKPVYPLHMKVLLKCLAYTNQVKRMSDTVIPPNCPCMTLSLAMPLVDDIVPVLFVKVEYIIRQFFSKDLLYLVKTLTAKYAKQSAARWDQYHPDTPVEYLFETEVVSHMCACSQEGMHRYVAF